MVPAEVHRVYITRANILDSSSVTWYNIAMNKEKICKNCKGKFIKPLNESYKQWENRIFCCKNCSNEYHGENNIVTKRTREKQSDIMKIKAPWKNKRIPQHIQDKMSISAKNRKIKIGFQKGSDHWNWKGGTSTDINKRINDLKWKEIRKIVYKRDNWTCQICKVRCRNNVLIQCHHIIPYRISEDNSLENLITLCASCHRKEEIKYYRNKR